MRPEALLLVSFGGPDGPDDVTPFLDNVLRGRAVPDARRRQAAAQYLDMGGASPLNAHNRRLVEALRSALAERGAPMPVYWGNRNWRPYLTDAVAAMRDDGVRRAAAFVTSAYSSFSSCRQYIEDIEGARRRVGPSAPEIVKLRPFFNHPGFVGPMAEGLRAARAEAGAEAPVLMSAHSLPARMAAACSYEVELREAARLVSECAGEPVGSWSLVFQSRSGAPGDPWLGPDIDEAIAALPAGTATVIVVPLGFVSDHMEVVYDLDRRAVGAAGSRGIRLVRTPTPGLHPDFVAMACELVGELADPSRPPTAAGMLPPAPQPCRPGCCPPAGR